MATAKATDVRRSATASRAAHGVALALLTLVVATETPGLQRAALPPLELTSFRLDPNTASAAELATLPRVGPALAAAIIATRESSPRTPAFARAADLDAVPRIGPATIREIEPFLRFPAASECAP